LILRPSRAWIGHSGEVAVRLLSTIGMLIVLAWAMHEIVHLHEIRELHLKSPQR
jgi:hypothetical protein